MRLLKRWREKLKGNSPTPIWRVKFGRIEGTLVRIKVSHATSPKGPWDYWVNAEDGSGGDTLELIDPDELEEFHSTDEGSDTVTSTEGLLYLP